ncbi:MAG: hypothetical protein NVSMB24_04620 [Mucilaginibacter sp.]
MKTNDNISYYCFNHTCKGSIYNSNSVLITDLPLTSRTLNNSHYCVLCNSKLISLIDIEIKQTLGENAVMSEDLKHSFLS